ncbi:mechanosensitive ion channel [Hymenobacter sp. BT188]|uniref:mechanosensitive ion channel family protein n=1 Tax=Hymenobacter sp. BT188 TaxID=2763504 RepID=UPI001650D8CC|nr:mechanosensitive ion channel domain-containing protein [Hymenobacter sp. BT188]MBC6608209.1 mechanosensitive ion channel [Hymenobacter sp. BT188]
MVLQAVFALTSDFSNTLNLVTDKLVAWAEQFVIMLPNLVVAILLLTVTIFAARLVKRVATRFLPRVSHSVTINSLISTLMYFVVLLFGLFFVLSVLNLDKTVTSLLAGVGIIGLALGFAFQDIAANFISGIIIAIQRPFNVGDMIKTNDYFGVIERIRLRTVDLRQPTGEMVLVPNRKVFENALINYSVNTMRRVDLDCGVAYDSDLEQVREVVLEAVQQVPHLVRERAPEVMFTEFADSAITFQLRFWIPYKRQVDFVGAKSAAIMSIKKAFDEVGISIPFPIRTLHVPGGSVLPIALQNEEVDTNKS